MNHLPCVFFGLMNPNEFIKGIQHAVNHIHPAAREGVYAGDNLFTYSRNLSFLEDEKLMTAFQRHVTNDIERAILWRTAVVAWGAFNGMRLGQGDFVECACYKGTTARIVCDYLDLAQHPERRYYLYDLFEHDPSMPHHALPEHSQGLYAWVKARFSSIPNVIITKGHVPDVLHEVAPEKIAFMHIDLNNAESEVGTLELLFDRMLPGAVLILDDYGWRGYRPQKEAEDPWFAARGYRVLELPTGQGLVIKHAI